MNETRDVLEFHVDVGLEWRNIPTPLTEREVNRRIRLIDEETDEWIEAWERDDFVAQVDALIDLLYVTHGTLVEMGVLRTQELWDEVQRSNLTKKGGTINEYGKLEKPDNYSPADVRGVLERVYGKCPD